MSELLELAQDLKRVHQQYFPGAWFQISKGALGEEEIFIKYGIQNINDVANGILQNDPNFTVMMLSEESSGATTLEMSIGNRVTIYPEKGSYNALDSVKLKFRKTTGPDNRIIKTFTTHMQNTRGVVDDLKDLVVGKVAQLQTEKA